MPRPISRRGFLVGSSLAAATVGSALGALAATPRKAAVIGHSGRGDFGHGLQAIFSGRPGIELVAVADPDPAGRERVARSLKAPRSYADYREMLEKERPALVSVAMRHADQHYDIGRACLEAGAHVYMEKPFVRSANEADELLSIAESKGLRIAVAHTMRMMPVVRALRKAVADGLLGELRELRTYGKQDNRAGGEDLMVLGTHLFDLCRMFCGDPQSVSGEVRVEGRPITRSDRRLVTDNVGWVAGDQVMARFVFPGGVQATFVSDGKLRETIGHWGIELLGSKGVARINCDIAPNVFVRSTSGWSADGRRDDWKPLDAVLVQNPPEHNLGPVGDWLESIEKGREPECSGRNGAWAIEMVMGIYASSLLGRRVSFPMADRHHPLEGAA
ncbi:MAG: Gfo/Idh/MocA family oxidoreductase [Verrucomicrobiales bacterium]|nr:Gfo/Idh/MocA family oxidoreductase [Verrucomicrobiales bacterium]